MSTIACFESGPHRFMSNFWPSVVQMDGLTYPTVEHAYQAAKTLRQDHREIVRDTPTPAAAKRAGRGLKMRTDWADAKVGVMRGLLEQKFAIGSELADLLEATGYARLEEGNTWNDRFWGVCRGTGLNMLGTLLMQIRAINRGDEFGTLLV